MATWLSHQSFVGTKVSIQLDLISTGYVKTGKQLGDIFTKALSGDRAGYLCNKLVMINIYAPTLGRVL